MMIELTDHQGGVKFTVNPDKFDSISSCAEVNERSGIEEIKGSIVYSVSDESYWKVKETPRQIADMIALDSFAKCALTGLCTDSFTKGTADGYAEESYRIAKAMLKAREEAKP